MVRAISARRAVTLASAVTAAFIAAPPLAGAATPAGSIRVHFRSTGQDQTFTVPDGVTSIDVHATGGAGGTGLSYQDPAGVGGFGALVKATLPVNPGDVLTIEVAGNGASPGGQGAPAPGGFGQGGSVAGDYGAGGGGGGATSVFDQTTDTLLLVAGGGGGGGAAQYGNGGNGGNAGAVAQPGQNGNCAGGQAGTASGAVGGAACAGSSGAPAGDGGAGNTFASGASGGFGGSDSACGDLDGGAGGGGYYGGAGGGADCYAVVSGGGGGAGTSYVIGGAGPTTVATSASRRPGLTIYYPSLLPTVSSIAGTSLVTGGQTITITGTNFTADATVLIDTGNGQSLATDVDVVSPEEITAVTPPGKPGERDAHVVTGEGKSRLVPGSMIDYLAIGPAVVRR